MRGGLWTRRPAKAGTATRCVCSVTGHTDWVPAGVVRRPVEVGVTQKDRVEILSGIDAGDVVQLQ